MNALTGGRAAACVVMGSVALTSGCSFLLDFPEEAASTSTGTGGSAKACYGSTDAPDADQIVWQATPVAGSSSDVVRTTGLFRATSTNTLYAFGSTTKGLSAPASADASLFLVSVPDGGPVALDHAGKPCSGSGLTLARRMASRDDDGFLLFASSLGIEAATGSWGFDGACGTGSAIALTAPTGLTFATVPFLGGASQDVLDHTDGVALDVDYAFPYRALFGVGGGDTGSGYFLRMADESQGGVGVTTWLMNVPFDQTGALDGWSGGMAFDDVGQAWFAANGCDLGAGCKDRQLVFGRFAYGAPAPSLIVNLPGVESSGSSVRFLDGLVFVGGRYRDSLPFLDKTLVKAASMDPFVVAVESTTNSVVWTYPKTEAAGKADRWTSVVDMAVAGTRECGAVYVTGCSGPLGELVPDCSTGAPGKTGFITKLDSKTGEVIWTHEIALGAPASDFFLPTALATGNDHVWLAATFSGAFNVLGQSVQWGGAQESVILRLPP